MYKTYFDTKLLDALFTNIILVKKIFAELFKQ